IRKLPSGRYQASYVGPDLARHNAPTTFESKLDAEGWLTDRRREITGDDWTPPRAKARPPTFGEYANRWLEHRTLRPRSRDHYRSILDRRLLPTFADVAMKHITAETVGEWHHRQGETQPTARAHAYALLRTILGDAVRERLITHNPWHIRGASNVKRKHKIVPATTHAIATAFEQLA